MKITIIGSFIISVPLDSKTIHAPLNLAYNLAVELARKGHEVTFWGAHNKDRIAHVDSLKFKDFNRSLLAEGLYADKNYVGSQLIIEYEQAYYSKVLEQSVACDIVYSWYATLVAPLCRQIQKPVVATHHDSANIDRAQIIINSSDPDNLYLVPVSNYMASIMSNSKNLTAVSNGISIDQPYSPESGDYFVWAGRIVPSKGAHVAIKLAQEMGFKLKIVGPMKEGYDDAPDLHQYVKEIKENIEKCSNIEYLGLKNNTETIKIMSRARALIFPSSGVEASSMISIEAMMCGTPVIASKLGPLPELIKNEVSGFLCRNNEEYKDAIESIAEIRRDKCREYAIDRFSLGTMSRGYLEQFEKALKLYNGRIAL